MVCMSLYVSSIALYSVLMTVCYMLQLHRPCFILGVLIFSSCWGHGFEGNGRIYGSKQRWNTRQTAWQPQRHSSRFSRRRPAQLFQGCGSRWWHSHATFRVIEVMCMYFVTFRALTRMLVVSYICSGSKSKKKLPCRECTFGGVYIPCIYLHARWELL